MNRPIIEFSQVSRCLLCHDAPCSQVCPKGDPARLLRALRFENDEGAAILLKDKNMCEGCDAPCLKACPTQTPILDILDSFKERTKDMEEIIGLDEVDLSCDLCGVTLENPFMLSSSVVGSNYEMCAKAFELGWAGVSYKTLCLMEIHETSPRFSAMKGRDGVFYGFKNIEQLSPHKLEEDLDIFRRLKKNYPTKVIIASIMGRNEDEWTYLAQKVTEAGADAIECNFSCPNMEEKNAGVTIGQDPDAVYRFVAAVKRGSHLPVLAKMTPNVTDIRPVADAAMKAGANGISAINTIKSLTNINLDTLATSPSIKGHSSVGGYSGAAVKPIALRFIADLTTDENLKGGHISGIGGIETWIDACEFLLLGANSLQVATAIMQYGYRIIDDLLLGLRIYMAKRGYKSVKELMGAAIDQVVELDSLERDTIVYPKFFREKCIGCGRCYLSCRDGGHQALRFDENTRKPILIPQKCVGCHLCVLVCPQDAIRSSGHRVPSKKKNA